MLDADAVGPNNKQFISSYRMHYDLAQLLLDSSIIPSLIFKDADLTSPSRRLVRQPLLIVIVSLISIYFNLMITNFAFLDRLIPPIIENAINSENIASLSYTTLS
jgi:hypothetical protein